jgi:hypothetical protein
MDDYKPVYAVDSQGRRHEVLFVSTISGNVGVARGSIGGSRSSIVGVASSKLVQINTNPERVRTVRKKHDLMQTVHDHRFKGPQGVSMSRTRRSLESSQQSTKTAKLLVVRSLPSVQEQQKKTLNTIGFDKRKRITRGRKDFDELPDVFERQCTEQLKAHIVTLSSKHFRDDEAQTLGVNSVIELTP